MFLRSSFVGLAAMALLGVGCSDQVQQGAPAGAGGASSASSTNASSTSSSAGGGSGGSEPGEWETLIEGDWTLPSGVEDYVCVVTTVPETISIGRFRPIAPLGTHHTVLTRGASGPDGVFPCEAFTNGSTMVYGSGVGTGEDTLPEGVAVTLEAGEKLLLNLHLFNTGTSELSGTSGVEVVRLDPSEVVHEAESVLAGPLDIAVPPQSVATASGSCTISSAKTLFGIGPHMHQFGVHMKVTLQRGGEQTVLHDEPYSFDEQFHYPLEPSLALEPGDQVLVECTYDNTSDQWVTWGDSTLSEMCFAGLFMYPATGESLLCSG